MWWVFLVACEAESWEMYKILMVSIKNRVGKSEIFQNCIAISMPNLVCSTFYDLGQVFKAFSHCRSQLQLLLMTFQVPTDKDKRNVYMFIRPEWFPSEQTSMLHIRISHGYWMPMINFVDYRKSIWTVFHSCDGHNLLWM